MALTKSQEYLNRRFKLAVPFNWNERISFIPGVEIVVCAENLFEDVIIAEVIDDRDKFKEDYMAVFEFPLTEAELLTYFKEISNETT